MAALGASLPIPGDAAALATTALARTAQRRAGIDAPSQYRGEAHPWTDAFARALRTALIERLAERPEAARLHEIAADWRLPDREASGLVRAAPKALYDCAWRVFAIDDSRLIAQPLAAECAWRGGWEAIARACDRLAQARCGMRVLIATGDPSRDLGGMTQVQAAAYRISAFAPKGESVLLAFYGPAGSWRADAGFDVFDYRTGERRIRPRPA